MWILDLLTGRPQVVIVGRHTPSPLTINTRALQDSLYRHSCVATFNSNSIFNFADDTGVVGLIKDKK